MMCDENAVQKKNNQSSPDLAAAASSWVRVGRLRRDGDTPAAAVLSFRETLVATKNSCHSHTNVGVW